MRPAAAEVLKVVLEGSLTDLAAGIRLETEAFLRLAGTRQFAATDRGLLREAEKDKPNGP